jgi:hypothetical protein
MSAPAAAEAPMTAPSAASCSTALQVPVEVDPVWLSGG